MRINKSTLGLQMTEITKDGKKYGQKFDCYPK